jgi:glycosyltransferase involved in cell wall biosynthesis
VWQVWDRLSESQGGLAVACAQLSNALASRDVSVTAISFDASAPTTPALDARIARARCRAAWPERLGYCPSLRRTLEGMTMPDVIHAHGLWRMHVAQTAGFARKRGIPVALSAHGMLHRHARAQRGLLKRIAGPLFQDGVIAAARCLHATSEQELEEIRRAGYEGPVAVIPWGVDPPGEWHSAAAAARSSGRRRLLFLGRIHPGKGLQTLLRAWGEVAGLFPDWQLDLAGFDEQQHQRDLEITASALGVASRVSFKGPVTGSAREQLFADSDLLVLPSPAENFGFVVAEALIRGVPVIATHGAPWPVLDSERCGWWIPADAASLAQTLADALDRSSRELREMGERGRQYALQHLTWSRVADQMMTLYAWMRGGTLQPDFVRH